MISLAETPSGSVVVAVGWGPGAERDDAWADMAAQTLVAAQRTFPHIKRWYGGGTSRRDALSRPLEPTPATVLQNSGEVGVVDGQDGGVTFGAWDGLDREGVSVTISVGCTWVGSGLVNSAVVSFCPSEEDEATFETARELLVRLSSLWRPDRGTVTPERLSAWVDERFVAVNEAWVGWMTYVPAGVPIGTLPDWCELEPLEDQGTLVIANRDPNRVSLEMLTAVAQARPPLRDEPSEDIP